MKTLAVTKIIPWLALLFGLALATSTALMSLTWILLLLTAVAVPDFKAKLHQALENKFILARCAFFVVFLLGCLWSDAVTAARLKMLSRLLAYGVAPLLFVSLGHGQAAKMLLKGFIGGVMLSAILSILSYIIQHPILQGTSDGLTAGALFKWTIFRGHLLHDVFLAIGGSFILCWLVFAPQLSRGAKLLWTLAYLLCVVDAMFLVQGRTGQIMLVSMSLFVIVYRFKFKGIIYAALASAVILPLLLVAAPALKNGINEFKQDQNQLQQGNYNTSAGLRKQFHSNCLALIKRQPLLGYGTGSFASTYAQQVAGTNSIHTNNPHGDLYLIGVEVGALGILSFILLIVANCCALYQPAAPLYSCMGYSLLLGYLIALTQNSFFMDNVSGLAYLLLMLSILVKLAEAKRGVN